MMKKISIFLLILFAAIGLSVTADAKLIKIGTATINNSTSGGPASGGGMPGDAAPTGMPGGAKEYNLILEDDQGLVWLDYTNQQGSWPSQTDWVAGLNAPGIITYKFDPGVNVSWAGDW